MCSWWETESGRARLQFLRQMRLVSLDVTNPMCSCGASPTRPTQSLRQQWDVNNHTHNCIWDILQHPGRVFEQNSERLKFNYLQIIVCCAGKLTQHFQSQARPNCRKMQLRLGKAMQWQRITWEPQNNSTHPDPTHLAARKRHLLVSGQELNVQASLNLRRFCSSTQPS